MRVAVLGGGQLGRMLALAGIPLGHRFTFLEPSPDPPAGQLGKVLAAPYDDPGALARIAEAADVVTYEFENVPAASAAFLAARLPVLPPPAALLATQDRLAEKRMFRQLGIPTAPFHPVDSPAQLGAALAATGLPAVIKTRRFGYDGKGQAVVHSAEEAASVQASLGPGLLAERFVDFERELSIVAARGRDGGRVFYPLTENHHRDGILRASRAPAPGVSPELQAVAEDLAGTVMERLEYAGVLAVELFEARGRLLANEVAPRVHNSGHWTLDGADTSQFENHVRAVTGLPPAAPRMAGPAAMLNIVGELPDTAAVAAIPGAHLHLYDKVPRPGRKLGHVNITGGDEAAVGETARRVWALLPGEPSGLPAVPSHGWR
ncbi:MAG: 5-(carboxyamino)imidazole ribonucleotide synthase [Gemmatimonadota bacterium]|nr:5-(carboxyamino)imidazole ribonucleotide synthase [Gemmatimonadota bacterium]